MKHLAFLTCALALGMTAACGIFNCFSFPFEATDVREVELILLDHPMLGGVLKRKALAPERIAEFLQALGSSSHRGICKAWTPYLIKFTLRDGSSYALKATDEMFSLRSNDDYYGFSGGAGFLQKFFPTFFE